MWNIIKFYLFIYYKNLLTFEINYHDPIFILQVFRHYFLYSHQTIESFFERQTFPTSIVALLASFLLLLKSNKQCYTRDVLGPSCHQSSANDPTPYPWLIAGNMLSLPRNHTCIRHPTPRSSNLHASHPSFPFFLIRSRQNPRRHRRMSTEIIARITWYIKPSHLLVCKCVFIEFRDSF